MRAVSEELDGGTEVPRDREIETEIDAEDLSPEVRRIVARAAWEAARDAINRAPVHNYGRISNGWGPWVRWAIGLALAAIIATISGWMSLHSDMAAMQQALKDTQGQVTQMYDWLAPRYRGNGNVQ